MIPDPEEVYFYGYLSLTLTDYRLMIYGAMLVMVILLMPHGILAGIYQIIFKLKGAIGYGDK